MKLVISKKYEKLCKLGRQTSSYNRHGEKEFQQTVKHLELGLVKEVRGTRSVLPKKINELLRSWDIKYQAHLVRESKEHNKVRAAEMTAAAEKKLDTFRTILARSLEINNTLDWDLNIPKGHFKTEKYPVKEPKLIVLPDGPHLPEEPLLPSKPKPDKKPKLPEIKQLKKPVFEPPQVSLLKKLFGDGEKKIQEYQAAFDAELRAYEEQQNAENHAHELTVNALMLKHKDDYANKLEDYEKKKKLLIDRHQAEVETAMKIYHENQSQIANQNESALLKWKDDQQKWDETQKRKHQLFMEEQKSQRASVKQLSMDWAAGNPQAIVRHASLVLGQSKYPEWISGNYLVQYDSEAKLLKVQFELPNTDVVDIPKSIKFIQTTGEFKETRISAAEQKILYDSLCYQIAIRTVNELYEADTVSNIRNILFNGNVSYVDLATGKDSHSIIMSAIFEREAFSDLNLKKVDPKACFKKFKGVAASSLIGLAPIPPVMEMDKEDRRFIDGKNVDERAVEGTNLAAMDWEEFEHLVRELFEREFASRGGEVKVTQSSSDGGVDAIAFDPDPISGGKIVIQAKRYTKTVGVSAVRDLYGTTMNEGASKGILVTTADYGPDAYKFASGKPITLMNGSNLLHLLEKHGMNAVINLAEARRQLGLTEA